MFQISKTTVLIVLLNFTLVASFGSITTQAQRAKTSTRVARARASADARKLKDDLARQAEQQVVLRTPWDNGNVYESVQEIDNSGVNETIRQMSRDSVDKKLVYINLEKQQFTALEDGQVVRQTSSVTTGKNKFETIQGEFQIWNKTYKKILRAPSPRFGTYALPVDYWMPFHKGYGLHDAPWRAVFGNQNYKTSGSHGCVNMQSAEARWLFEWSNIGTTVFVSK